MNICLSPLINSKIYDGQNYMALLRNGKMVFISDIPKCYFISPREGYITALEFYNEDFDHRAQPELDVMVLYEDLKPVWYRDLDKDPVAGISPTEWAFKYGKLVPSKLDLLMYGKDITLVINGHTFTVRDTNVLMPSIINSWREEWSDNALASTLGSFIEDGDEIYREQNGKKYFLEEIYYKQFISLWRRHKKD